ncbi:MAG: hypothetical protein MOGMAGMI_01180 [Candidatus Omnitrophica bacterium]|nr:hypothetical protein [Candidatus Omnitrophota bacterium]
MRSSLPITVPDRLEATLAFDRVPGLGARAYAALVRTYGDEREALGEDPVRLGRVPELSAIDWSVFDVGSALEGARREIEEARRAGVALLPLWDEAYPEALKAIHDPPAVLRVIGRLPAVTTAPAVAIVGSRKATRYGSKTARGLAAALGTCGCVIVSGLARGIDTAAHEGALDAGAVTWAVLGGGVLEVYPQENLGLAERIVAAGGALISERALRAPATPQSFPMRNRLISALASAVVVAEAGAKSGALNTVDSALEQGRDVYAVPGNIDSPASEGTNRLIRQGARPVVSAAELVRDLGLGEKLVQARPSLIAAAPPEDETMLRVYTEAREGASLDEIAERTGLGAPSVARALSLLTVRGLLRELPGKRYEEKIS